MSDKETPSPGDDDPLAQSRRVVSEAKAADGGTDEATRITRIVLIAVILVLVGGLALLLVFGPAGDNSAREAVGDLSRSQVSIRDNAEDDAPSTSDSVTTDTAAPAETAPPTTEGAPTPAPPASDGPPAPSPPNQPAAPVVPARLEIFYAVDSQGRLPVKVGQSSQISIRNNGGGEGAWALNATGPLRVDGVPGTNGRVAGGSISVITVTVDAASAPSSPTEATIRFDTPDGESRTIQVQISP